MAFTPREAEKELFEALEACYCTVYGGYIRDVLRGAEPTDVDIVVEKGQGDSLFEELGELGYTPTSQVDDELQGLFRFEAEGRLPLDVLVEFEYTHDQVIIAPMAAPDANVNLLAWAYADGKYELNCWDGSHGANEIIAGLKVGSKEIRISGECTAERRKKLEAKGFVVVGTDW